MASDATDGLVRRRSIWSRYWASGMPHSCGTSYDETYGGELGRFWRQAFAPLGADDRVLDIATGNAALPRLLVGCAASELPDCEAVDIADVAPEWLQQLPPAQRRRIRVQGGVAAESLPFADASFTLVVSQYGIEYADRPRALAELHRVLHPAGRVRLLVHHAGSRTVALAQEEITHLDWLLQPEGLLDLADGMVEPIVRAASAAGRAGLATDAAANRLRARFNETQKLLANRLTASPCPDPLHEARDWVAQALGVAAARGVQAGGQALRDIRRNLDESRQRLHDLCRCALDEAAASGLCAALRRPGGTASATPLSDRGHLLGWAVVADPPP